MKTTWARLGLGSSTAVVVLGAALALGCSTKGSSKKRSDATTSTDDDSSVATDATDGPGSDTTAGGTDDLDAVVAPDVGPGDVGSGTQGDAQVLPDAVTGEDVTSDTAQPPDVSGPDTTVTDTGIDAGPADPCLDGAVEATVYGVTKGEVGEGVKVSLKRLIATSPKFVVSRSKSTGSCLWGLFVSAGTGEGNTIPLGIAAPYSGLLAVAFGDNAIADNACPVDTDPFPAAIAPGDELDLVGSTQTFVLNACANEPSPPEKGMKQLTQVCGASLTGAKRPVPAAAVLTDEAAYLSTPSGTIAQGVHDRWQGARVRVENAAADVSSGAVVGKYGTITLTPGPINVVDKLYYGKNPSPVCSTAPVYSSLAVTFDFIEGFHYLDYCTWSLAPLDRCADYSPSSDDCVSTGTTSCQP